MKNKILLLTALALCASMCRAMNPYARYQDEMDYEDALRLGMEDRENIGRPAMEESRREMQHRDATTNLGLNPQAMQKAQALGHNRTLAGFAAQMRRQQAMQNNRPAHLRTPGTQPPRGPGPQALELFGI